MPSLWEEFLTQMSPKKERYSKPAERVLRPAHTPDQPRTKKAEETAILREELPKAQRPPETPVAKTEQPEAAAKVEASEAPVPVQRAEEPVAVTEHVQSAMEPSVMTGFAVQRQQAKRTLGEERTSTAVDNEADYLLSQIDEFRERAKKLQELMASKESKAQELENIVSEREVRANALEQELSERQEAADGLLSDFTRKVDILAESVTDKMADIENNISKQVEGAKAANEAQLAESRRLNEEQIAANRRFFEEQSQENKKLFEEQIAVNRKFLEEQTQENRRLFDSQLSTIKQSLEEQAIANKKLSEGQIAEVKTLLETNMPQFESIKTELSEKVHSENVKCYRNIQDLFTEFDSKIEKMDNMEQDVGSVKKYVKLLSWFSILDFVVLIAFVLVVVGIF